MRGGTMPERSGIVRLRKSQAGLASEQAGFRRSAFQTIAKIPRETAMSSLPIMQTQRLGHAEYFALEQACDQRYEYHAGEVYAMAGGSESHALIAMNLGAALVNALRGKPCRVNGADMKLHVHRHDLFCYPDVQVLCERGIRHEQYVENPVLIVEVLSPSTESYDRGLKFERYRDIDTLAYYLLVDSTRRHVDLFERESTGGWRLTNPSDRVVFEGLETEIEVDEIYRQVEFGLSNEPGAS
jgi:Uma2 family endonuclease